MKTPISNVPHIDLLRYSLAVMNALASYPFAIKATKFVSSDLIVRGTRRVYSGRLKGWGLSLPIEVLITIGRPNFAERKFIKDCKKAGEPFPVKKVQFKFYQKKGK